MSRRDPVEALSGYYAAQAAPELEQELLNRVFQARNRRGRNAFGALCGVTLGAVVAVLCIVLASTPISGRPNGEAAIARSQIIRSGLVSRAEIRGPGVAR